MPELTETEDAEARELARSTPMSLAQARELIAARRLRQTVDDALDIATVRIVPNRTDRRRADRVARRAR